MSENLSPNILFADLRCHYVTCLMCRTDYSEKLDINDDDFSSRPETGYCPRCALICRNCEKKKIDLGNNKGLCTSCEKLWQREFEGVIDADDDKDNNNDDDDDDDDDDDEEDESESEDENQDLDDDKDNENDLTSLVKHLVSKMVLTVCDRFKESSSTDLEHTGNGTLIATDLDVDPDLEALKQTFEEALTDTEDDIMSVHALSVADPDDGLVVRTKRTHGNEISRQLLSEYQKSHGRVGSDGSGGSTNGELAAAGCKKICTALDLHKDDVLCDIGSGGGLALMQMTAEAGNKCSIGIEFEHMRHIIATNFNKRLMEKRTEKNCPVVYHNADILTFPDLNGITKVYMYDAVFEPSLLLSIGQIFNASKTIQYIASTQKLPEFGFDVELHMHLGSLAGRGGNMSHTFSVYKSNHYEPSSSLPVDKRLTELFSVAMDRNVRYHMAKSYIEKFHSTKMVPRSAPSLAFGVNYVKQASPPSSLSLSGKSEELYNLFMKNKSLTLNGITYSDKKVTKTNTYWRFNEEHLKSSKIECGAVVKGREKKALVVPSYSGDVKNKGKLLVGIIHDPTKNNGNYVGVVYDLHDKVFKHNVKIAELYYMFDYTSALPDGMEDIMKQYRKMYPLDNTRTTNVPDKRAVALVTPAKQDALELATELRSRPPSRSRSNKRKVDDVVTQDEEGFIQDSGEEVVSEKPKSSKVKRTTPIEDKLRANVAKQSEIIAELKRKLEESAEHIRSMELKPRKQPKEDTKAAIDEAIQKAAGKYFSNTAPVEAKLSQLSIKNAELTAQVKVYQESFTHIKTQQDRLDSVQKAHEQKEEELLKGQREAEKKAAEMDTKYQVASKEAEMYKLQQKREDERQDKEQTAREKATAELYSLLGKFAPNK